MSARGTELDASRRCEEIMGLFDRWGLSRDKIEAWKKQKKVSPLVKAARGNAPPELRSAAVKALAGLYPECAGPNVVDVLRGHLDHPDPALRWAAAKALTTSPEPSFAGELFRAVEAASDQEREVAYRNLTHHLRDSRKRLVRIREAMDADRTVNASEKQSLRAVEQLHAAALGDESASIDLVMRSIDGDAAARWAYTRSQWLAQGGAVTRIAEALIDHFDRVAGHERLLTLLDDVLLGEPGYDERYRRLQRVEQALRDDRGKQRKRAAKAVIAILTGESVSVAVDGDDGLQARPEEESLSTAEDGAATMPAEPESQVRAPDGGVSLVAFRNGAPPQNEEAYAEELLALRFPGSSLTRWRIVGVRDELRSDEGWALYQKLVVEGRLEHLGWRVDQFDGRGPDGVRVLVFFMSAERPTIKVTEGHLRQLAAYWRSRAREWWKSDDREEAICDGCDTTLLRDDGYLHGSSLLCRGCCDERLGPSSLGELRKNPDYFGSMELERAGIEAAHESATSGAPVGAPEALSFVAFLSGMGGRTPEEIFEHVMTRKFAGSRPEVGSWHVIDVRRPVDSPEHAIEMVRQRVERGDLPDPGEPFDELHETLPDHGELYVIFFRR